MGWHGKKNAMILLVYGNLQVSYVLMKPLNFKYLTAKFQLDAQIIDGNVD